uniref:Biotin carboxyl carrier protein of acetyl-CoA carboxylase n=1 Tax=Laurenciella marilzae TaxID=1413812 RepID=A0A1Z1M1S8_9FLOR|nr:acetyl-CoA carboxylase biotin carboxyl carrier protein [Laurenciella marilzae]ARW59821.1 acetyl-CoA carboxylase biotin carboxyl carrier protein [Laurenciella marilzae]
MTSLNNIKILVNSIKNNNIERVKVQQKHTKIVINKTKKHLINIYNYSKINKEFKKANVEKPKIHKNIEEITQAININNIHKDNKTIQKQIVDQSLTYSTIISPMVGTFYRSPAPNESPFVEINSTVKTKQTVCIIEAMKLMNEIEAEVQGEIVEILVQDGDIVDCGQALMKVKVI